MLKKLKIDKFSKRNSSDKRKVFINTFLFILMQMAIMIYAIIRIFLINIYLGVTNYGLLNLMISLAPITTVLISAAQAKSLYVLYEFSLKKDYTKVNEIINEQINEIKKYSYISFIFVAGFMIFSFFLFKSPGLSSWLTILFILSGVIELLSYSIIIPYVQWYLNAIYKNYIYDGIVIFFSTIINVISFTIIVLYGNHIIIFNNISFETSSVYITLIVSFLLTSRIYLTNLVLFFLKRKFLPWFKRIKIKNKPLFNKNSSSYIIQEFLGSIASLMIPIVLYVLSIFINLSTGIAGVYYSYLTFTKMVLIIGLLLSSLKPYLAKIFFQTSQDQLFFINKLMFKIGFYLGIFLTLNMIMIVPYIMIFSNSLFSFLIAFLMGINVLISVVKLIDENFIYIHGKPEKYIYLTLFEIIIGGISIVIGMSTIFLVPSFSENILNILYCILICEIILRSSKYIANVWYLNKYVYKKHIVEFLKEYYKVYCFFAIFIVAISLFLLYNNISTFQTTLFTTDTKLDFNSIQSIGILYNDIEKLINWTNLVTFVVTTNIGFLLFTYSYIYFLDRTFMNEIFDLLKINKIKNM